MNDQPIVFLSSTFDGLADLRGHLEKHLLNRGFGVSITEQSLALVPGSSVRDTCLQQVEASDLLVLVLDKRAGSPVDGNWLVVEEFRHAVRHSKPLYVCVRGRVWERYTIWRKNEANSSINGETLEVDPQVLEFLREIADTNQHWIIQFKDAADLATKLHQQLASLFAQLLRERSHAFQIRVSHLVELMQHMYRQQQHVQTVLACEEILKQDSFNVEALLCRAVSRIRLHGFGDIDSINAGILDCERALEAEPGHYRARYNLANFRLLTGRYSVEEIHADLEALFEDFPDYRFYFERDKEFHALLTLREAWGRTPEG